MKDAKTRKAARARFVVRAARLKACSTGDFRAALLALMAGIPVLNDAARKKRVGRDAPTMAGLQAAVPLIRRR
jgi:hypothetical protein